MATYNGPPELPLTAFELPKWLVESAVRSCRLFNTALDFIFYDVPTLRAALAEKDAPMQARGEKPPSRVIDFDALSDPEGSLLLRFPPRFCRGIRGQPFLADEDILPLSWT